MGGLDQTLQIAETFVSILGEAGEAGWPAFFIRLAGCNLRCRYCDTTYAYEPAREETLAALVAAAAASGWERVLVTGGEPLLQPACRQLLQALADRGHRVLLETNGSLPIAGLDPRVRRIVDWKCPGSGMAAHNYLPNLQQLTFRDELKFVISSREDFLWALEIIQAEQLWRRCPVLLSPVFGELAPRELAAWILDSRLPLRLNLQLHKYIWGPNQRGV